MIGEPDFCGTISTVIDVAQDVINLPTFTSRLEAITHLTTAVDAQRALAAEGGNPIRGEVSMLLEALGHIEAERAGNNHVRASEWAMVGGVLLPMVRQNLALAIALRSRRPSTSEGHDFKRGRA